ncbi:MAG TPA: T9SS type A sorting domain-containing protein [Ohtaekwangia sp.]|uniref:T9SS type A sorting domain-containing protein n=1 Tax=Ohtaekwangia sp. TaxID=2066019 RepID=UPI002F95336C
MKHLYIFLILLFPINNLLAQNWTWGLKATGSGQSEEAAIAVNHRGDIVIAGYYQENFALASFTLPLADDYYSSMYLSRINSEHEVQWLKRLPGKTNGYGDDLGVTIDDDQNIYVTGMADDYIFVSKYDSLGNVIWRSDLDSKHYGYGSAIYIDQFDNVYVSSLGGWNFFMTKLDYNGKVLWSKDIWVNYSDGCHITDLEVDALGNLYFVGVYGIQTLPLDPFTLQHDSGWGENLMFGKLDTNGNFLWVKNATGYLTDSPKLALTANNYLYIGGGYAERFILPEIYLPGTCCNEAVPFIAKYKTDGTYVWAKIARSYNGKGVINDIQTDHAGNLYTVGGYFTCYGNSCTEGDYYVEKYTSDGQNLWRSEFATPTQDAGRAIDIDNKGFLYLVGSNQSTNFINPISDASNVTTGVGQFDTKADTYKRTPRPGIDKYFWACTEGKNVNLLAKGQNINWYSDAALKHKLKNGNSFSTKIDRTDTVFVTQTVNGIESWPKAVILVSPISSQSLELKDTSIIAPQNDLYTYQWYYKSDSIQGATNYYINVDTTQQYENFSVAITQGPCVKVLDGLITSTLPESSALIRCFPNPTTGSVTLQTGDFSRYSWQLLNLLGNELASADVQSSMQESQSIDLKNQPAGTYLIRVKGDNFVRVLKIVKH